MRRLQLLLNLTDDSIWKTTIARLLPSDSHLSNDLVKVEIGKQWFRRVFPLSVNLLAGKADGSRDTAVIVVAPMVVAAFGQFANLVNWLNFPSVPSPSGNTADSSSHSRSTPIVNLFLLRLPLPTEKRAGGSLVKKLLPLRLPESL